MSCRMRLKNRNTAGLQVVGDRWKMLFENSSRSSEQDENVVLRRGVDPNK